MKKAIALTCVLLLSILFLGVLSFGLDYIEVKEFSKIHPGTADGKTNPFVFDGSRYYFLDNEATLWGWGTTFEKDNQPIIRDEPFVISKNVAYTDTRWVLDQKGKLHRYYGGYNGNDLKPLTRVFYKENGAEKNIQIKRLYNGYILDDQNNLYMLPFLGRIDVTKSELEVTFVKGNVLEFLVLDSYATFYSENVVLIIDDNKSLWVWSRTGSDSVGISATGKTDETYMGFEPDLVSTLVKGPENVKKVFSGNGALYVITESGDLFSWGTGSIEKTLTPKLFLKNVSDVFIPEVYTLNKYSYDVPVYIKFKDGTMKSYFVEYFGSPLEGDYSTERYVHEEETNGVTLQKEQVYWDALGQLNLKMEDNLPAVPVMTDVKQFTQVILPQYENGLISNTLILQKSGQLFVTGHNDQGLLGMGIPETQFMTPFMVPMSPIQGVERFYVDQLNETATYFALQKDGSLWGWGANEKGQLANGTADTQFKPVRIIGGSPTNAVTPPTGPSQTVPASDISVFINGTKLLLQDQPVTLEGRTLVPMRAFFEALGASVSWTAETKTINANRGQYEIAIVIDSKKTVVNGKEVLIDVPATLINGRTYVPLRFIGEALGEKVEWRAETKSIMIQKQ